VKRAVSKASPTLSRTGLPSDGTEAGRPTASTTLAACCRCPPAAPAASGGGGDGGGGEAGGRGYASSDSSSSSSPPADAFADALAPRKAGPALLSGW